MKKNFLGSGWSFPPDFTNVHEGVKITSDEQNIQDSLIAIVNTIPGERVMRVGFGCNLRDRVFASMNLTEYTQIKSIVTNALEQHEPRVIVEEVSIDSTQILEGQIIIVVEYTIISTNQRNNIVFPYYISEATEQKARQ